MAKLTSTRGAQTPLVAEFVVDVSTAAGDSMPTVVGNVIGGASPNPYVSNVQVPLGSVGASIFDVIGLPPGAVVTGGELTVETAVVGPTVATVSVGDAGNATRYLGATSVLAAAKTALVPTGFVGIGDNIRITVNNTVAVATAGKYSLRVQYMVRGRVNEQQSS